MKIDLNQMPGKALSPAPLPVEEKAFIRSQTPISRTGSAQRTVGFKVRSGRKKGKRLNDQPHPTQFRNLIGKAGYGRGYEHKVFWNIPFHG
jgi:hypothetical protein